MTKQLRCPSCDDHISVIMETCGPAYMTYEVPSGFECDNIRCGATWDVSGDVTFPSMLDN